MLRAITNAFDVMNCQDAAWLVCLEPILFAIEIYAKACICMVDGKLFKLKTSHPTIDFTYYRS